MKIISKVIAFILVPLVALLVISNHIRDKSIADSYTITSMTGQVFIQHQGQYPDKAAREGDPVYEARSVWIPLTMDMNIGPGITVKTEAQSSLDLLVDEGMVFQVKESTILKINENPKGKSLVQVMLSQGKVMSNLVTSKLRRLAGGSSTYKIRVDTNNAVCGIRGTVFAVGYYPKSALTDVAVLEGTANVFKSAGFSDEKDDTGGALNVSVGKKVEVSGQTLGLLQEITEKEKEELEATSKLKTELSTMEGINKKFDLNLNPVYQKILVQIADYGMNNLSRAFIYRGNLKGALPNALRDIELASGTYQDPWGTDYVYVKISDKKAILISAGPDKILHSGDDIYKYINL